MSDQPGKLTAQERVEAVERMAEQCHPITRVVSVGRAIDIAKKHAAAQVDECDRERRQLLKRVADLERKLSETYASRSALDCQYAGAHGESDGASHCPPDKPCQRCLLERERDGLIQASAGFIRAWEKAESERDEARAEVEKCAATGWYGLVEYERRRANEANAAVRGLAEERTRAVVRAERVERERDEARAEVEKLRVLRAQAEPFVPATMLAVRKAFALGELRHEHNVQIVLDTQMRAMVVELRAALKAADGGEVL